jgi:hypothetical protein
MDKLHHCIVDPIFWHPTLSKTGRRWQRFSVPASSDGESTLFELGKVAQQFDLPGARRKEQLLQRSASSKTAVSSDMRIIEPERRIL